ncbi:hypothetical protein SPM24T3_12374 [Serratia sp. M24T3]|nr:hypothetical protein SPM24T3_12374 [Serratia sp. M24T3]
MNHQHTLCVDTDYTCTNLRGCVGFFSPAFVVLTFYSHLKNLNITSSVVILQLVAVCAELLRLKGSALRQCSLMLVIPEVLIGESSNMFCMLKPIKIAPTYADA